MIFEAQTSWRSVAAFPDDRVVSYDVIKFGFNDIYFFVDADNKDFYGDIYTERFVVGTIKNALLFLESNDFVDSKISLLLRRCDNEGEYLVTDLVQAFEAKTKYKASAFVYVCSSGKRYVQSDCGESEEELTNLNSIYLKE